MTGLLKKVAELTDEQLSEGSQSLADATAEDLQFVREAMLMEMENRKNAEAGTKE